MEYLPCAPKRFFAGRLDANDRLTNGTPGSLSGAGYHTDPGYHVTGSVSNGVITLRAPAADFGVGPGTPLFSVTGIAMAGPTEANESSIFGIMRSVDPAPP